MKKAKNRERILSSSIELFNQSGVVAVTTNHIAAHLGISPGNLYFHFRNKEEIIRELFDRMCASIYEVWLPDRKQIATATPLEMIERTYEIFWTYRYFHREVYHLRRRDPILERKWKRHLAKTMRLLQAAYDQWVRDGVMRKISDPKEMQMISDTVLLTSSSFLLFYESPERPATRRSIRQGVEHLVHFLLPYHTEEKQKEALARLSAKGHA